MTTAVRILLAAIILAAAVETELLDLAPLGALAGPDATPRTSYAVSLTTAAGSQPRVSRSFDLWCSIDAASKEQVSSQLSSIAWDLDGNGSFEQAGSTTVFEANGIIYLKATMKRDYPGSYAVGCEITYTDQAKESATSTVVLDRFAWDNSGYNTNVGVRAYSQAKTGVDLEIWCWLSHSYGSDIDLAPPTVRIEWDLDGDGVYELTGDPARVFGQEGSTYLLTTKRWDEPGEYPLSCRRELADGTVLIMKDNATVWAAPPAGWPGVSINGGAEYTNSRTVQLRLVWPFGARNAVISNDGGFPASRTQVVKVGEIIDWTLDSTVTGLFTRNVYVRFDGGFGQSGNTTYSDDIILDTTPPVVESASAKLAAAGAPATEGGKIKIKARDDISGVAFVQVNTKASPKGAKTVKYGGSVKSPGGGKAYVRVQDRAGNWSQWQQVKQRKK